jgi:hypothetical protein
VRKTSGIFESSIPGNIQATVPEDRRASAASMCYDAGANQLVIPMNANNALAFIRIE